MSIAHANIGQLVSGLNLIQYEKPEVMTIDQLNQENFELRAQLNKLRVEQAAGDKVYNDGYNQGLDHAMKLAAVICDHMMVKQISNVFLLEFAIKLAELKELQSRPINETINKSSNGNIDTWNN